MIQLFFQILAGISTNSTTYNSVETLAATTQSSSSVLLEWVNKPDSVKSLSVMTNNNDAQLEWINN